MRILNVSTNEFAYIHAHQFDPTFESYMINCFGCRPKEPTRIVVRKDVPSVPWWTAGVTRHEEEAR